MPDRGDPRHRIARLRWRNQCLARSAPSGAGPRRAAADARHGLALVGDELESTVIDDRTYWSAAGAATGAPARSRAPRAHLLQVYDEYVVAYRQSRDVLDVDQLAGKLPGGQVMFLHAVVLDGQVVGHWRRELTRTGLTVETRLARPLDPSEAEAVDDAVTRYGAFVGLPVDRAG